jgi:hypothetical protein
MKKRIVLKSTSIRFPISSTILYTFLMMYFNAPEWAWTLFITFEVLWWALIITAKFYEAGISLNDDEKKPNKTFQERLAELQKEIK